MRHRFLLITALLGLTACGVTSGTVDTVGDDGSGLDPAGDADGDGYTNGDEDAMGSDPNDADDVPYEGGWVKDDHCSDSVVSTGNGVGQVAEDFTLLDQYGQEWHLSDFCDRVIAVEFGGFT